MERVVAGYFSAPIFSITMAFEPPWLYIFPLATTFSRRMAAASHSGSGRAWSPQLASLQVLGKGTRGIDDVASYRRSLCLKAGEQQNTRNRGQHKTNSQ
jgi:hypothetical protein